ncbi:SWIM zinc finger domain-containing protein, partial [Halorubrum sp. SS7]
DPDAEEAADAVAFLEDRTTSGTPLLSEHFERAATELEDTLAERRDR